MSPSGFTLIELLVSSQSSRSHRFAPPGRPGRARSGPTVDLREQPQAYRHRPPQLRDGHVLVSAGRKPGPRGSARGLLPELGRLERPDDAPELHEQTSVYNAINFAFIGRGNGTPRSVSYGDADPDRLVPLPVFDPARPGLLPEHRQAVHRQQLLRQHRASIMWLGGQSSNPNGIFANGGQPTAFGTSPTAPRTRIAFASSGAATSTMQNSIQDIVVSPPTRSSARRDRNMIDRVEHAPGWWSAHDSPESAALPGIFEDGSFGATGRGAGTGDVVRRDLRPCPGNTLVPPNRRIRTPVLDTNSDWDSGGINGLTSFHLAVRMPASPMGRSASSVEHGLPHPLSLGSKAVARPSAPTRTDLISVVINPGALDPTDRGLLRVTSDPSGGPDQVDPACDR